MNAREPIDTSAAAACSPGVVRSSLLPRHDPVSGLALGTGPGGQTVVNGVGREPGEVTILDFDDMDDYDGVEFGGNGNFDGPVDAFGTVIPDVDVNGVTRIDPTTGLAMPLQGWSQAITVEKVDPYDFSQPVAWAHTDVYRTVDRFPLRVTVTVKFQGPLDPQPDIVTTMTWIAPAH